MPLITPQLLLEAERAFDKIKEENNVTESDMLVLRSEIYKVTSDTWTDAEIYHIYSIAHTINAMPSAQVEEPEAFKDEPYLKRMHKVAYDYWKLIYVPRQQANPNRKIPW